MGFHELKRYFLNRLNEAIQKNEVDEPILDLLNLINSLDNYFTTSSCAGRIVLMKIPKSGKKFEAEFLFKSHYEINYRDIWDTLLKCYNKYDESIWFKQEPFILHIACKDLDSALKILDLALKAGLKHSGIFVVKEDRVMVEVQGNERIETIVAKDRKLLISEEYMKILVEEANKKLRKTRVRMKKFYELIQENA